MRFFVVALLLVLSVACGSSNDQEKIKAFVADWSRAVDAKDIDAARKFYQQDFVLPKIIFEVPEGISFTLNIDAIQIEQGKGDSLTVAVPYHATSTIGLEETNTVVLHMVRTGERYSIFDMSPELALKVKELAMEIERKNAPADIALRDSLLLANVNQLQKKYDSVVYYADVNEAMLFYVVTGNWEDPYSYDPDKQRNSGDYKIGVVTADDKTIIPVEFDKIYNPNGSFAGMIEVEKQGKRGLYTIEGKNFLSPEYDGIFPVVIPEVFAQVEKDGAFGWVNNNGVVSFDAASNSNKDLFKSPLTSKLVDDWSFTYPGDVTILRLPPHEDIDQGVIVYPSFLYDLGVTPIANGSVSIAESDWGMGMEENTIRVENAESVADKFYALVGFFMEAGTDAREYHTEKNDVIVIDQEGGVISRLPNLTIDEGGQDPCDSKATYKSIEPGFYEVITGNGIFKYYKVNSEGEIEELSTPRQYAFTKYVKIDESYFDGCQWEHIPWEGRSEDEPFNIVVASGLTNQELDVMRNEIFAEYGFIFKSEKWKKYFEEKEWYKPQFENVDHLMTETDKHNVKFILEYQQKHKDLEVKRDSINYMWAG
jgi:hypothetical protein